MATPESETRDLARVVLLVLFIIALTVGCLWILRPFLTALVGATTIAISTWPMLTGLQRRCGGRRGLAIAGMMAVLAIAIMAPLYFGAVATVQSASSLSAWLRDLPNQTPPALAEGLVRLPLVGPRFEKA
jgi:predicted PurR-regulated permease PerM